jgi:cephalosporin hydroxylase
MNDHAAFKLRCSREIEEQGRDESLRSLTKDWFSRASKTNYSYHFEWLGRPVIQFPQDIVGVQQILWNVQPDLIIETGVARGGSLIFYASILELIAQCGGSGAAMVLGVDIDIREHNRREILAHPMSKRIQMLQGSSTSEKVSKSVADIAKNYKKVLVCLDSNHTHEHVLEELKRYAPLVSKGSYCVVFDTVIEDMPDDAFPDRPWGRGNNPRTAVFEYLGLLKEGTTMAADGGVLNFAIDKQIENQLLITVAPDGFLARI